MITRIISRMKKRYKEHKSTKREFDCRINLDNLYAYEFTLYLHGYALIYKIHAKNNISLHIIARNKENK